MKIKIGKDAVKFVKPDSPKEVRIMAARGAVPLSPREVVTILYILCHDKDGEVKKTAIETLRNFSPEIILNLIDTDLDPSVVDFLVRYHKERHLFYEKAVTNKKTLDETISHLASESSIHILELIALNQERLSKSEEILRALFKNPNVKGATRQKLMEFLEDSGYSDGVISPADENIDEEVGSGITAKTPVGGEDEEDGETIAADMGEDLDGLNLAQRIMRMNVGEKMKIAHTGDKEVRSILLKESNKPIIGAVMRSPKITEGEILVLAQSKHSHDEILRLITLNREWLKNYAIRLALVTNPKTPTGVAIRLVNTLYKKDLKDIAASRSIPSVVVNSAKKMLIAREKRS